MSCFHGYRYSNYILCTRVHPQRESKEIITKNAIDAKLCVSFCVLESGYFVFHGGSHHAHTSQNLCPLPMYHTVPSVSPSPIPLFTMSLYQWSSFQRGKRACFSTQYFYIRYLIVHSLHTHTHTQKRHMGHRLLNA